MSTPKFHVNAPQGEDGVHIFLVNGTEVSRCDHDTAGWEGVADQLRMFRKIAEELGITVEETIFGETDD